MNYARNSNKMHIFRHRQKLQKKTASGSKAQTSFFVILGIVMFVFMLAGYFVYNDIKKSKAEEEAKRISDLSLQAAEIQKFANDCIRKESFEGLKKLGETGGYLDVPKLISFKGTGYWHLDQANIQPFLNQTQERLIEYVNSNVPKCFDNENLSKYGFLIEKGEPAAFMEFGNADVTIKVNYPIKVSKETFTKQFSDFFNTFDIRYRAIFEAATEINEKTFEHDFEVKNPLKKLDYLRNLDFDLAYKTPETDVVTFTVTDRKSITPSNELYAFSFAAKLGKSELKKLTDLQNRSSSNPSVLPYTTLSVDKKAQLDIFPGTTMNLNGSDVKFISVQQSYPVEAVTKDVPVYKKNKDVIQKQDIKYIIDNPVYTFEPSGLLFNKYERLTLYYDPANDDSKGVGILMGKKGFWVPIPSKHEPEQKRVFSSILGFTEFTAINCASQTVKQTVAEHFFEPNAGCYIQLVIMVIAIIFTFGVLGAALGGIESASGSFMTSLFATLGAPATIGGVSLGVSVGLISTVLFVVSTAVTIIGTTTDMFYDHSPDQCETFYPSCDQTITVEESGDAAEGKCIPSPGPTEAKAGQPVTVCAQVESCGFVQKFVCKKCSQICTAKFY